jgi:hypothetical protein
MLGGSEVSRRAKDSNKSLEPSDLGRSSSDEASAGENRMIVRRCCRRPFLPSCSAAATAPFNSTVCAIYRILWLTRRGRMKILQDADILVVRSKSRPGNHLITAVIGLRPRIKCSPSQSASAGGQRPSCSHLGPGASPFNLLHRTEERRGPACNPGLLVCNLVIEVTRA